jgi:hypothetical protein
MVHVLTRTQNRSAEGLAHQQLSNLSFLFIHDHYDVKIVENCFVFIIVG